MNCFKFPPVSSLLFTGHLPTLVKLLFSIALSFFSFLHWNIKCSTVCIPCLHEHSASPIIFSLCKYERMFPWPVIIVVIFELNCRFTASLLSTLGKNSLVIAPFVVSSQCFCYFLILFSRMSFCIALFGILLYVMWWFCIASFASLSAISFP